VRLSLLGSGDAAGMPLYGCQCKRCVLARADQTARRAPCSALLEVGGQQYLIDAGLMNIADRFPAPALSGIFVTHFHADHVQGLLHLRWGSGVKIPVYCPPDSNGCADLFKHPGILDFQPQRKFASFRLGELSITPLPLIHSKPTFGYLFEHNMQRIAYLVDTRGLPPKVIELLADSQLQRLVIDTTAGPGVDNGGHNNLDDTLLLHRQINAEQTIMTHINHDFDGWLKDNADSLPADLRAGHDGYAVFP
jgi:phosphoribosyl 1,2-cyclic phosphate phosphodiesterase